MKQTNTWQEACSAFVYGAVDVAVTHPLWSLTTMRQTNMGYKNIFNVVKYNPLVLYNGVMTNAVTSLPISISRYYLSKKFDGFLGNNNIHPGLLASSIAGGISASMSLPIELSRTAQLSADIIKSSGEKLSYNCASAPSILCNIYKNMGIKAVVTGYPAIAARDSLYTAAFLTGVPVLSKYTKDYFDNDIFNLLFACTIVSSTASVINHPVDTIKTIQHSNLISNWQLGTDYKIDAYNTTKQIYKDSGASSFFKGYFIRNSRFLFGLVARAVVLKSMDKFWLKYNNKLDIETPSLIDSIGEIHNIEQINDSNDQCTNLTGWHNETDL